MKICAYVQEQYGKANYKTECMDTRQFVGLRVIVDCLERAGYAVDWAGIATVHQYDLVLVSLTSDCDWWSFIAERVRWKPGKYQVIVGGAGLLHIEPFLPHADWFMFGRGEHLIVPLVKGIESDGGIEHESVAHAATFSPDRRYRLAQTTTPYPFKISRGEKTSFLEGPIGCNHKCLFCGYTWHRKFVSENHYYKMEDSLFGNIADKERAMLDLHENRKSIDFKHLRTTAIDGMSERLRKSMNKPITKDVMLEFLDEMLHYDGPAHQIKFYNLVGLPTETEDDWLEFTETLRIADERAPRRSNQWSIVLHSTPFRAMPATPLACAPMSYRNYRGEIGRILGRGLKGNLIYQGQNLWSVESMGTESLPTVILSAIAHRGTQKDQEAVVKLAVSKKFWRSNTATRIATLEKHFDVGYLFGEFSASTLPSRYLRSYAKVEKMWPGGEQ